MPLFATPFNALDYCVMLILLSGLYRGYRQGFVLSFFNFFGVLMSLVLTRIYYDRFAEWLKVFTPLNQWITGFFDKHLDTYFNKGVASKAGVYTDLPFGDQLADLQAVYNLNQHNLEDSLHAFLVGHLSTFTLNIISMILLFLLLLAAIQIVSIVLNIASQLPVVKGLNKMGGLLFGLLKQYIWLSIGLLILVTFSSLTKTGVLSLQFENSLLVPYLMRYNVLLLWMGSALLGL